MNSDIIFQILDWSCDFIREYLTPSYSTPTVRYAKYRAKKVTLPAGTEFYINANFVEPDPNQKIISGFSKLSKVGKLKWLAENFFKDPQSTIEELRSYWHSDDDQQKILDGFSENTISNFPMPFGVAPNFLLNDKTKLLQTYNRFNRIMGGFSFLKTALYDLKDLKLNYPVNYFPSIALYNDIIKEKIEEYGIKLPYVLNEILKNENIISKFIGKEINLDIINNFSLKENIKLEVKFGQIQIEEIPTDSITFNLAVLNNYGKSKSKSVEDLIAVLFEKLDPVKREEVALIFGLNSGYDELRNYYKLKDRIFNVKFDFESKLDYHIVETLYQHSNHLKSSKFQYLNDYHNFNSIEDKVDNEYVYYNIFGSTVITKRKDYLEALERIIEEVIGSIITWFPKGLFTIHQNKMKNLLMPKVRQIYLDELQVVKTNITSKFKDKHIENDFSKTEKLIKKENYEVVIESTFNDKETTDDNNSINISLEKKDESDRKSQLEKIKITELRKIAKQLGISGCTKDKLEEIIPKIIKAESSNSPLL